MAAPLANFLSSFAVSPAVSYISSIASSTFGRLNPWGTTDPVEYFDINIKNEPDKWTGRFFAEYTGEFCNNMYNHTFFLDFAQLSKNFQEFTEKVYTKENFHSKELVDIYMNHYNTLKLKDLNDDRDSLFFGSFDKLASDCIGTLKSNLLCNTTDENSRILGCMLESFEKFFEQIDKNKDFWMSPSRTAVDIVKCLVFIKEKFDIEIDRMIVDFIKIMNKLENESYKYLKENESVPIKKRLDLENDKNFVVFRKLGNTLFHLFGVFYEYIKATTESSNKYEMELPFIYLSNGFFSIITAINAVGHSPHKIEKTTQVNISSRFLIYISTAFIHISMSKYDLSYSMLFTLARKNMSLNSGANIYAPKDMIIGGAIKFGDFAARIMRNRSITGLSGAENTHGFDVSVFNEPLENSSLNYIEKYYFTPVIKEYIIDIIDFHIDRLPYELASLTYFSEFTDLSHVLQLAPLSHLEFKTELCEFAIKELGAFTKDNKPSLISYLSLYTDRLSKDMKKNITVLENLLAISRFSEIFDENFDFYRNSFNSNMALLLKAPETDTFEMEKRLIENLKHTSMILSFESLFKGIGFGLFVVDLFLIYKVYFKKKNSRGNNAKNEV